MAGAGGGELGRPSLPVPVLDGAYGEAGGASLPAARVLGERDEKRTY